MKDDRSGSRMTPGMEALEIRSERDILELEMALLRRGMSERDARREGCSRCRRTPLVGERVYAAASGALLCELCRKREADPPASWSLVHGPEFGHSLRLLGGRAA